MKALKRDSLFGEELVNNFRHQLEDFFVVSFYESLPYKKIGLVRGINQDTFADANYPRLSTRNLRH